ncbi:hypothetical protein HHK36_026402 [Tetracentron sinense]|uniref:Lon proteolytic domain-containing protein n=1 Tax=Tetracentron sinense TaxID=13715 RepID=A0A834YFC4_TETSI|nr:hypothetical protein HHK36_026402 [Tetracentron sinense]
MSPSHWLRQRPSQLKLQRRVESKASSDIVPTNPRPEDYPTVLVLPLPHRPIFPGSYMPIYVKRHFSFEEMRFNHVFSYEDEPGTDPSLASGSETDMNIYDLKGKELFNRRHEVGTLAQITSVQGDHVVLIGHRQLRITEMVSKDPLTVKVDHLKACYHCLNYFAKWLVDFGAAISGANKLQCQKVLEELDVYKRLKLTLELVKKEMEITKIQELGLEMDDKTAFSGLERASSCHPVSLVELECCSSLQLLNSKCSDENFNIYRAQTILDEDHYGLIDIKERILEFIAVGRLRGTSQESLDNIETEKVQETEVSKTVEKVLIDTPNLSDFVSKPVFHAERIYFQTPVGVVMGLAWTAMGGSSLYIETTHVEQGEGKGALHLTGQLGDVRKESAQIADCHPKDGPSAGCTMITSMLSLAMKKSVKKDLAMTGEVTLTGRILPIGGVKEKTIAARRSDVKTIIFPSANRRDFGELAVNMKEGLEVYFFDDYSQIFDLVFGGDQDTEK